MMRMTQDNSPDRCSPVSSFDWSAFNTQIIAAATLDSICTIWDIDMQQPVVSTRAHPSEIYDIAFSPIAMDTFITCGKDGSIRLFDMRCVNKYSIFHKREDSLPVLRVAWNPINAMTVGFITHNQQDVTIIDVRSPDKELKLSSHVAPVNAIEWSPNQISYLVSVGEDGKVGTWRETNG